MTEEKKKSFLRIVWDIIVGIGILVAIPAAYAEFTGNQLPDILGTANNTECVLPNLEGVSEAIAIIQLKNMGLTPVKKYNYESGVKRGTVIAQYPTAESIVQNCRGEVVIEISSSLHSDYQNNNDTGTTTTGKFGLWSIVLTVFCSYIFMKILDVFS